MPRAPAPAGIVLAGGLARRMGGVDKALLPLADGSVLDELLGRLIPQCGALAISANGDPQRFAPAGYPVIADAPGPPRGPLAGVLAGLDWLASHQDAAWLLTVPGDTPFVPVDLAARLQERADIDGAPIARIRAAGRLHPLVALWSRSVRAPLREALHGRDLRKVTVFQAEMGAVDLERPAAALDPFFNINTPEDLAEARSRAAESAVVGAERDQVLRIVNT